LLAPRRLRTTHAQTSSLTHSKFLELSIPVAYIAATLEAILNGHPQSRIEELMPWRFRKTSSPDA
jgi:hypothetical protein